MHIHIACFADPQANHGGAKRTRQIISLMEDKQAHVIGIHQLRANAFKCKFSLLPRALRLLISFYFTAGIRFLSPKGVLALFAFGLPLCELVYSNSSCHKISAEVCPDSGVLIACILASLGIRCSLYPHNVEFLVPGQRQRFFRGPVSSYCAERFAYCRAASVIAISKYDASILSAMGCQDVSCLPFNPVSLDKSLVEAVRKLRKKTKKEYYLLLGSASNPPTRIGMENLISLLWNETTSRVYKLAGYGTEQFVPCVPDCVSVMGAVDQATLIDLMAGAKALVIWQPPTSGILTRLVEAKMADLPSYVFGGYHQAYEMHGDNIFAVNSLDEIPV